MLSTVARSRLLFVSILILGSVPAARARVGLSEHPGGGLTGQAGSLDAAFPARATGEIAISRAGGGESLRWTPSGLAIHRAGGGRDVVVAPRDAVAVATESRVVEYRGLYPGVTERYRVEDGRIKHDVVFDRPIAGVRVGDEIRFSWTISTSGVGAILSTEKSQAITILGADQQPALAIPAPFVVGPLSEEITRLSGLLRQEITQDGESTVLSLTVPAELMQSPEAPWPLVIDPTIVDLNLEPADLTVFNGVPLQPVPGLTEVETGDLNVDGARDLVITTVDGSAHRGGSATIVFGPFAQGQVVDLATATSGFVEIHASGSTDRLGHDVAIGDLDHDGDDDLVLAANTARFFDRRGGEVYVWYGKSTWPAFIDLSVDEPDLKILSFASGDRFGNSVDVGDLSGNGLDDLLVGAGLAEGVPPPVPRVNPGEAYGFFGPLGLGVRDPLVTAPELVILGPGGQVGDEVAIGDISGDGAPDVAVASRWFGGELGLVLGFFGPFANGTMIDCRVAGCMPDVTVSGDTAGTIPNVGDLLGSTVRLGDVTADGEGDLVISSPGRDAFAREDCGEVFVYAGPLPSGFMATPSTVPPFATIRGRAPFDGLDRIEIGDVTGDGATDLALATPGANGPSGLRVDAGATYLFHAPVPSGLTDLAVTDPDLLVHGAEVDDRLGAGIAIGALSDDCVGDLVMGASGGDGYNDLWDGTGDTYVRFGEAPPGTCGDGACCAGGSCTQVTELACDLLGGTFHGVGSSCAGRDCTVGACCYTSDNCVETTPAACARLPLGQFCGFGVTCTEASCFFGGCN